MAPFAWQLRTFQVLTWVEIYLSIGNSRVLRYAVCWRKDMIGSWYDTLSISKILYILIIRVLRHKRCLLKSLCVCLALELLSLDAVSLPLFRRSQSFL